MLELPRLGRTLPDPVAKLCVDLGWAAETFGLHSEACVALRRAHDILVAQGYANEPSAIIILAKTAENLLADGRTDEAHQVLNDASAACLKLPTLDHPVAHKIMSMQELLAGS